MWPEHLVFVVLGLTSVFSAVAGFLGGRHLSDRALDFAWDEGQEEGWHACDLAWQTFLDSPEPALTRPVAVVAADKHPWRDQIAHDLSPEALEAAAADRPYYGPCCDDVPADFLHSHAHSPDCAEPDCHGCIDVSRPGLEQVSGDVLAGRPDSPARPGHHQTPAQRRRDKHKQRGQYALTREDPDYLAHRWAAEHRGEIDPRVPMETPVMIDLPAIDWTGELAAIRRNGQTDWYTCMMAMVA